MMRVYNIEPIRSLSFNAYRHLAYISVKTPWLRKDQLDKRKIYGYYHAGGAAIDFIEISND